MEKEKNKVYPKLGFSLILDYLYKEELSLDSNLRQLLNSLNFQILNYSENFQNNVFSSCYFLAQGTLTVTKLSENKSFSLFFHILKFDEELMKQIEVKFNDFFGWENCFTAVPMERGNCSKFLMNENSCNITLFKNLDYIHREQSKFQDLRIYDSDNMGRIMILDTMIQITNQLEDNYTIDLSRKVVKNTEINYEHILMIGAGDMIIPTYILRKYPVNLKKYKYF